MTRRLLAAVVTVGFAFALAWSAPAVVSVAAGQDATSQPAGPVPRMADGHPDLSGVWWGGGDVGAARGRGARGGGRGGARGGTPPPTFMSLYKPEAAAKAKTLSDKDDPTLRCVPTAFGTLNVSLWDVGAVGQIVATPKMIVMLTETYHGFRLVPTDGRPHRDDSRRRIAAIRSAAGTATCSSWTRGTSPTTPGCRPKGASRITPTRCTSSSAIGAWTRTRSRSRRPSRIRKC